MLLTLAYILYPYWLYQACTIKYVLTASELHLSNGLWKQSIPLASIESVTPTDYYAPLFEPGGQVIWYCNRGRRQLRIRGPKRAIIISPSDPEQFRSIILQQIQNLRQRPQ